MTHLSWIVPSAFASFLCLLMSIFVWKRRKLPVARAFYWVLLVIFIWVFSRLLIMLVESDEIRVSISKFQYIGIAFTPVAWLAFSLTAIRLTHLVSRRTVAVLSVIPLITVLVAVTNDRHGWLWKRLIFQEGIVTADHGGWFAAHIAYSYLLIGGATLFAAVEYLRHPRHKTELIAILVAPLTVLFANFNNLAGVVELPTPDPVSVAFSVSILLFSWVVLKDNYLQLVPVARAALVDNMPDSFVVLDDECRVVDANPAATRLLGGRKHVIGSLFGELLSTPSESRRVVENGSSELVINGRAVQALNTRIAINSGMVTGYLIVFRDITELKDVQTRLEQTTRDLREANEELRHLASTDVLTGVLNRRAFFERFELELSRRSRTGSDLCMLILDLDHFKQINDQHGHGAGDAVLRRVGAILVSTTRKSDVVGRLGGEEFGVVFPDTGLAGARQYAERLRTAIEGSGNEGEVPVTASLGLAAAGPRMGAEEIYDRADRALYLAKRSGRNRVEAG